MLKPLKPLKPLQLLFTAAIIVAAALPFTSQAQAQAQAQETEKPSPPAVPAEAEEAPKVEEPKVEEAKVKPYAHTSSKGSTYYLFSREQKLKNSDKVITMYYFAKDPENKKGTPVAEVPEDREVAETKTGLLVLKKKKKKKEVAK